MSEILGYDKYGRPVRAGDRARKVALCPFGDNPYPIGVEFTITGPSSSRKGCIRGDIPLPSGAIGIIDPACIVRIDPDQFTPAGIGFSELVKKINGRVEA